MKKSLLISVVLMLAVTLFSVNLQAQTEIQPKYSQVRIFISSNIDEQRIVNSGLIIDHGINKQGHYFETWLSEDEIKLLNNSGVPYQITIDDWMEYYNSLPQMSPAQVQEALQQSIDEYNVSHSIYGTMGGHLKWEEAITKLDSLRLEYPGLISQKFSIGNSYQNRPIWTVRVSNSPNGVTGRPQVWLNAVTHAREPLGMSNIFYFLYWLFENYNIDPVATYILKNREIYFTPFINPDGYVYNQTTNPNGGGMWRKNRTPQGSATGVDLNRNYGIFQFWNSSNNGSSTSPSSDTYRGTAPFSEPETQIVRNYFNTMNFKTVFNYHTYGNYLIRPWAWCDPIAPPDSMIYHEWGADMTQFNNYEYGLASTTVGYKVRGDAGDWMHHDSGHTKSFPFTPEVGSAGFWPSSSLILPQAQECVWMNIYLCMVAGPYVNPKSFATNKQTYVAGETGNLKVVFRNKGLDAAANVKVEFTPVGAGYITIPVQLYSKASMPSMTSDSVTFNFTLSSSIQNNQAVPTRLKIKQQDSIVVFDQMIYIKVGSGVVTFADSAENGFSNWVTNQGWAVVTSQYHSPTHSFTDSPTGNYAANANNSMTLNFNLNGAVYPAMYLSFWHRYVTEANYDYCNVEVSSNGGTSWQTVKTYHGSMTAWTSQTFDISSFVNGSTQVKIRFRLTSDVSLQYDGWYVDDIKITSYTSVITGITGNGNLPLKFSLEQNYPNPFNPQTSINYSIAKQTLVKLVIFDMLGRNVTTLVNEVKTPGDYSAVFNGDGLASGIYYYRITAGNFVETRKMLLIK